MSDIWEVLIPEAVVQERIAQVAPKIQQFIDSSEEPVTLVLVAQGGLWFGYELMRHLTEATYRYGLIGTTSYGEGENGGEVEITFNRTGSVKGHNVILIDDIGDRRKTLLHLQKHFLLLAEANSVTTAVLLNKPDRREVSIELDFVGFNIPDTFVSGCGLDGGNNAGHTRTYRTVRYKKGTLLEGTAPYEVPTTFPQ